MNSRNKIMVLAAASIIAAAGTLAGCYNKKSESDIKVEVELNEYFLEENKELQELLYSFNKDYATAAADNINKFDSLVAKYGYSFSSNEAVEEYNTIVELEEKYFEKFTAEELAQIEELQIRQIREKEGNR